MMNQTNALPRRQLLAAAAAGTAAVTAATASADSHDSPAPMTQVDARNGSLQQSVCRWCFKDWKLPQLSRHVADLGMVGIDLLGPDDFDV